MFHGTLRSIALASSLFALSTAALASDVEPEHGAHGDQHGAAAAEHGHGDAHGDHDLHINWFHGFLGEKDGVEPSLLYRPTGMPMPVGANILNSAILFFIIVYFGRKPVAEGLAKRKARIVAGMEEAAKMKAEAEAELQRYEQKLQHIEDEIERVRREMRESAEAERKRILAEAKERRARMERDARLLVEQELKATREELIRQAVDGAVRSAQELLAKELSAADHQRIADEYILTIQKQGGVNALGGKA